MTKKDSALLVAEKAHSNQSYGIFPYMYHIKQVVKIAEELGYDESIIVACVLHDTLEDTELSYNDIRKAFGEEVAQIVYAVTDELGRNRKERKKKTYPKIKANWKAVAVKVCDRIANIEHSAVFDPSFLNTYKKEHRDFLDGIFDSTDMQETDRAWIYLNKLMI